MKSKILIILKKELREMFRDKKSLAMMLLLPIMIPLLVLGMSALFNDQSTLDESYKIGFNYELTEIEKSMAKEFGIEPVSKKEDNLKKDYSLNQIDLYVIKEDKTYTIYGNDNETTALTMPLVQSYLDTYKKYLQNEYFTTNNINPEEVFNIITINTKINEEENFFANYIVTYAFLFIIMAITVSATYPATDATAGEKERGTLETLLTFPIKSKDIIIGKFLSVSISSIITGMLSLILTIISLFIANNVFEIYKDVNLMLSPVAIIFSTIVIISYSFLISGLCIAIASKAKTFKEAQSALTPLSFISFFPSFIAFMVEIKSSALLSLVPFLNFTLLFTDITKGNVNIVNILLMIASTVVFIAVVLYIIIEQYKSEKVLFSK